MDLGFIFPGCESVCHSIIMSQHLYVTASLCHSIIMSQHHHVTASLCHSIFMSQHHYVTASSCHIIFMSQHLCVTALVYKSFKRPMPVLYRYVWMQACSPFTSTWLRNCVVQFCDRWCICSLKCTHQIAFFVHLLELCLRTLHCSES